MRVYTASSWRNAEYPELVDLLRKAGHEVHDFRTANGAGFHWSEIDPAWERWDGAAFLRALKHPLAEKGFNSDYGGMLWADACVLVLPAGRSAHSEAGAMHGWGKPVAVYAPPNAGERELMWKMFDAVCLDRSEVLAALAGFAGRREAPPSLGRRRPR